MRMVVTAVGLAMVVGGCGGSAAAGDGPAGGTISGTATTQDGRPIPAFDVSYAGFPAGKLGTYDGNGRLVSPDGGAVKGTDGHYQIKLPDGQYGTEASVTVQWHGRPFQFPLESSDGKQSSVDRTELTAAKGTVRNYVWKLTGPRPGEDQAADGSTWGRATYGACVGLRMGEYDKTNGTITDHGLTAARQGTPAEQKRVVELTLTPHGKLIDGSDGKAVVGRVPIVADGTYSGGLRGVPVGDYTATARLLEADGTEVCKLRLSLTGGTTSADYQSYHVAWRPAVEVVFDQPYEAPLANLGAQPAAVYVGR